METVQVTGHTGLVVPEGAVPQIYIGKSEYKFRRHEPKGQWVELAGKPMYRISNYDSMEPFFLCLITDSDVWGFISTTGVLTAGRMDPDHSIFPYTTVDRIQDAAGITGPSTAMLVDRGEGQTFWQPFSPNPARIHTIERNIYKSPLGDHILFEEINHELGLAFRNGWTSSDRFGVVKTASLVNINGSLARIVLLDGVRNLIPAGVTQQVQQEFSCLTDAYKMQERIGETSLAVYTMASGLTDRPVPMESLFATIAWSPDLSGDSVIISDLDPVATLLQWKSGEAFERETRGCRGGYLAHTEVDLNSNEESSWRMVFDTNRTQSEVAALRNLLLDRKSASSVLDSEIQKSAHALRRLVAGADGEQQGANPVHAAYHRGNVLYNIMRGGVPAQNYIIQKDAFISFVGRKNRLTSEKHAVRLGKLNSTISLTALLELAVASEDPHLERLALEYLPLTFSRRHGDPSRPWNRFSIRVRDENGKKLLTYQGNWRDIFQNWEALGWSYPELLISMIARFVNATTKDGYNPYRLTADGFEWEEPEPDNPWASIGYWGDHQIIYLLKLLETAHRFYPSRIQELLKRQIFAFADVPYEIAGFDQAVNSPRETIAFNKVHNQAIQHRVASVGQDGKQLPGDSQAVLLVNLCEKLLIPLLTKLTNFAPGAGIWMSTQRPEWNDANNALAGYGASVVTLNHLRRYVTFLSKLIATIEGPILLSEPVARHLKNITTILKAQASSPAERWSMWESLGREGERHRGTTLDEHKVDVQKGTLDRLLEAALVKIDETLEENLRPDRLFHSYNLLDYDTKSAELRIKKLGIMLEGQVAALSSGQLTPEQSADMLEALRESDLFREDQQSYILYPNKRLPGFLEKNIVPEEGLTGIAAIQTLLVRDTDGTARFHPSLANSDALEVRMRSLNLSEIDRTRIRIVYEQVFNHHSFTGRSSSMFAYEGLGSIYWHMVSKLLLATQEAFLNAFQSGANSDVTCRLALSYYDIRSGLGFEKSPEAFGAFPIDPYSHTPEKSGARQPGMTGQVKEGILARWGELGINPSDGILSFSPILLQNEEFSRNNSSFHYVDQEGSENELHLGPDSLAFTFCGLPIIYSIGNDSATIETVYSDGSKKLTSGNTLSREDSRSVFQRDNRLLLIHLRLTLLSKW